MDLRQFRYFVAVAEELNFTRAAKRLHISQPPLSQHILEMERQLGALLFNRTKGGGVSLTGPGEIFLQEARKTLAQAERAIEVVQMSNRGEAGQLRIGYGVWTPYSELFRTLMQVYRERFPGVEVTLKLDETASIMRAVENGDLDVGLIRPVPSLQFPPQIHAEPVFSESLMVALPSDHPLAVHEVLTLASLANEAFVLQPSGGGIGAHRQIHEACMLEGFEPRVVQKAKNAEMILSLVSSGAGLTILPASLQYLAMPRVVWRELSSHADLTTTLFAISRLGASRSAQQQCFLELMREQVDR